MEKKYLLVLLLFVSGAQINAMSKVRNCWDIAKLKYKSWGLSSAINDGDYKKVEQYLKQDVRLINDCSLHKVLNLAGKNRYGILNLYLNIAEVLIQNGVDLQEQDQEGNTLLYRILFPYYFYNPEYGRGKNDYKIPDDKKNSFVQLIIDQGDIDINEIGERCMLRAIDDGFSSHCPQFNIIKLLVENGVRVNRYHDGRENTYIWKILKKQQKLWHWNLRYKQYSKKFENILTLLIKKGANVHIPSNKGHTYLSYILDNKKLFSNVYTVAKELIIKGADPNTKDKNGNTLLKLAAGNKKIRKILPISFLLENGADPNLENNKGYTPLMVAIRSSKTVNILLKNGGNVNLVNRRGNTLLTMASGNGCRKVVEIALKYNADVDEANGSGDTPLILAVHNGDSVVVDTLIKNGANVNLENSNGDTPLTVALRRGRSECAQLLIKNGGCVSKNTELSKNRKSCVKCCKKEEIFQLLWQQSNLSKKVDPSYWLNNLQPEQIENTQAKIIAKKWLELRIPQLVLMIKQIKLKKNTSKADQLMLKKCTINLAKKRGVFKQFVFFNAFENGDIQFILSNPALKGLFVSRASQVVRKIQLLEQAAQKNNIQQVCDLLQKNHLFVETLEAVLIRLNTTNPVIRQAIQKRIDLQNMEELSSKEQDTYFAEYVECIKQSLQKNDNKNGHAKKKRKSIEGTRVSKAKRVKRS